MRTRVITAGFALCFAASMVWADTLILRNGTSRSGRFISGSGDSIVFQDDNGSQRTYQLREVQSLSFDNSLQSGRRLGNTSIRTDTTGATAASGAAAIPAGTDLVVRTNEAIEAQSASEGRTYSAEVDRDIRDTAGNVVVPRGSDAELVVREVNEGGTTGSNELVLDLQSLRVGNRRYLVSAPSVAQSNEQGLGKNRRTAEMVGGGAVLGTVLGAIAGGGKGAAIGAVAGAAAGAGAQVLTRGKEVKVPAESTLTFKLDQPINLVPQNR